MSKHRSIKEALTAFLASMGPRQNVTRFITTLSLAVTLLVGGFFVPQQAFATITSLTLTSPTGGENWSGTQNITWTYANDGTSGPISILLSKDGGLNYNNLVNNIPVTDGSYSWDTNTINTPDGTLYKIKISDPATTLSYESASNFTIDNTAPTITVEDGTAIGPVQNDDIKVTVTDATTNVVSQDYGFSTTEPTNDAACSAATGWTGFTDNATGVVDFTVSDNHTDYLCVRAEDQAGNIGYKYVGQLNTDNTAPTIAAGDIVGTTIQGGNDTIKITFSEDVIPVDPTWSANEFASIDSPSGTTFTLANAGFSYDSSTHILTITLDEATDNEYLKNGEIIEVTPAADKIKDFVGGNSLANSTVTGTTTNSGDSNQPTAAITYTNNGPVKDGDTLTVTATFNEALDTQLATPKSLLLCQAQAMCLMT